MASAAPNIRPRAIVRHRTLAPPRWTAAAWGAIASTLLFLGITCWWLTQDRSVPVFDAGLHLHFALQVHEALAAGEVGRALTLTLPYPPLVYLVASLGLAIGGVGVAPAVLAENLVFVPLLALGCYHVGRLVFNSTAGFLAVVFALGSPLVISLFHVIMIDGPETAMVAISLWAILATESFSRTRVSALAGLCVGMGMLTKEPFAFFVAGPLLIALARGGWRRWRNLLVFALVALAVALPWYIHDYPQVHSLATGSFISPTGAGLGADIAPHSMTLDNFEWYGWTFINAQLYLPLFAFFAIGLVWLLFRLLRRRPTPALAPELLFGGFLGWLAITETFAHDTRYGMPLLVYLAVLGAGWVATLPRRGRTMLGTVLVAVAVANVAGIAFGAGGDVTVKLPGAETSHRQNPGMLTFFSDEGFLAGAPIRDGNVLATMRALRRSGVRVVLILPSYRREPSFSAAGVSALAAIAGMDTEVLAGSTRGFSKQYAFLGHGPVAGGEHPCVRLSDGSGVWIGLGDITVHGARYFCPTRRPRFYGSWP